jgi:NifU-like protein involved in Fe-S cluster formation
MHCCGVAIKPTSVSACFERGRSRMRQPLPGIPGETVNDHRGLQAAFAVRVVDNRLLEIGFRATTCITLIAYCERLRELIQGSLLEDARRLDSTDLINALPGVPAYRQNTAVLALFALRAALLSAEGSATPTDNAGATA